MLCPRQVFMHALEMAGFRHASFSISSSNVLLMRHYLQEAIFPHLVVVLCHSCAALKICHYCLSGAKRGQVYAKQEC